MAHITSVDLPHDERVVVSLTCVYSISHSTSEEVLAKTEIGESIRVKDLTEDRVNAIRNEIDGVKAEGDLHREVQLDIKHLVEIGCCRGIRHGGGLPVRGQRTETNARTRRGPARTVANRKKQDDRKK